MPERTIKRRNRPPQYPAEDLLNAAAEVFRRRGFHEASMLEIASEAGATKPTLYARFGNKEALYDRVMGRTAESLVAHMATAYEGVEADTAEEASRRPARAFFEWVRANPVGFHLLFVADHRAPTGVDHRERALAALTELVAAATTRFLEGRGLKPGLATGLIAAYVVGIFDHGARWAVDHGLLEQLDLGDFSAKFILSGLHGVSPEAVAALARRRRP